MKWQLFQRAVSGSESGGVLGALKKDSPSRSPLQEEAPDFIITGAGEDGGSRYFFCPKQSRHGGETCSLRNKGLDQSKK